MPAGVFENLHLYGHTRRNTFGYMDENEVVSGGEGRGRDRKRGGMRWSREVKNQGWLGGSLG